VPFYEKGELEDRSTQILAELNYSGGEVDLVALCAREAKRSNLVVRTNVPAPHTKARFPILGRISFEPLVIQVYSNDPPNRGRDRFTLAHELAHYLLGHGKYLLREACDDSDFLLQPRPALKGCDISRMEFQANYLAASILMPRAHIIEDFQKIVRALGIADKGFGQLYVDTQPCNIQNFQFVTGRLMQRYGVSQTAVKIRLESIGLLRDARDRTGLRPLLQTFESESLWPDS
jgi:Zn-dependent peptidase ImmA (M78 family)